MNKFLLGVIGDSQSFYKQVSSNALGVGIDISDFPVSHLGYKTATVEDYVRVRNALMSYCSAYAENFHNGRNISVMRLKEPLLPAPGVSVSYLEIMPPKPSKAYPNGLEHVGVVIGEKLEEFAETYKHVMTGKQDQGPNCQPYFIRFSDGSRVKFYNDPLDSVIVLEGNSFTSLAIPTGLYRHYKGKEYRVVGLAKNSETLEDMVIYQAQYSDGQFGDHVTWVRPLGMFLEKVEVNGKQVDRFERIGD